MCLRFSRNSFSIQRHSKPFLSLLLSLCVARIPMRDEPLQKAKNSYLFSPDFISHILISWIIGVGHTKSGSLLFFLKVSQFLLGQCRGPRSSASQSQIWKWMDDRGSTWTRAVKAEQEGEKAKSAANWQPCKVYGEKTQTLQSRVQATTEGDKNIHFMLRVQCIFWQQA